MKTHQQACRATVVAVVLAAVYSVQPEKLLATELGEGRLDEIAEMGPRQLSDRAEAYIREMREILDEVLRMLNEARAEKDVVKLNCVNEKLTHLRGLVRVSEQGQVNMQEAIALQDMAEARHEFTKIRVARDRVRQLRAEAAECVGQLAFLVDEDLEVEVEIPPDLPDGVTDIVPVPPVAVRPPMASPVR